RLRRRLSPRLVRLSSVLASLFPPGLCEQLSDLCRTGLCPGTRRNLRSRSDRDLSAPLHPAAGLRGRTRGGSLQRRGPRATGLRSRAAAAGLCAAAGLRATGAELCTAAAGLRAAAASPGALPGAPAVRAAAHPGPQSGELLFDGVTEVSIPNNWVS